MLQQRLAGNEIDIEVSRALILKSCWELDTGAPAGHITSITTFVTEAVNRVGGPDEYLSVAGVLILTDVHPSSRGPTPCRPLTATAGNADNRHDVTQLLPLLDAIPRISGRRGRPQSKLTGRDGSGLADLSVNETLGPTP
jgi:acyl-CoA dehydrogenase